VIADLDTLLTALYVELTDRIIPSRGLARRGPGKPYALQIAFSPDGATLAISTLTSIQLWDVATGHVSTIITYGPYDPLGPVSALADCSVSSLSRF
jgi:phage tail protein X